MSTGDPYEKFQRIALPLQDYIKSSEIRGKMAITKFDYSDDDKFL